MTISEEINAIRDKYAPKDVNLKPSHYCRNTYAYSLGECQKCGMCGREFSEDGALKKEAQGGIDKRPIFDQLEEAYGWKGK